MAIEVVAVLSSLVVLALAWRAHQRERVAAARVGELEQVVDAKQHELAGNFQRLNQLALVRLVAVERERIMREMHDGLGGTLVSTLAMIESGETDREVLADAIRSALEDMRLVIDSLDPDVDDVATVLGMLRCRLEPRLRRRGVRFDWQVDDLPALEGMGPEQYLHILRIVQESVTNAIKHTSAATIRIATSMDESGEHALIEVEDDGGGFDDVPRGRGLGNMERRAHELGGSLAIDGGDGGTRVRLTIPLHSDASVTRASRHRTITGLGR